MRFNYLELKTYHLQLDTLFVTDSIGKWKRIASTKPFLDVHCNLNTILKYFFNDCISTVWVFLSIISIPKSIREDHEIINFIHIGDTRHIAMINLIAELNPVYCSNVLAEIRIVSQHLQNYFSN